MLVPSIPQFRKSARLSSCKMPPDHSLPGGAHRSPAVKRQGAAPLSPASRKSARLSSNMHIARPDSPERTQHGQEV